LVGGADHVELGSAIRSAGAFGWSSLFVDDRAGVWFGGDHSIRTEGRAAARRAKNPIKLVPATAAPGQGFDEAIVVTAASDGIPLHRAALAGGSRQLIVVPDESAGEANVEDWTHLASRVRSV